MKLVNIASILATAAVALGALQFDATAASPSAETQFISQVHAAFDSKDSAKFVGLVCWDNVESTLKESLSREFANLVAQSPTKIELIAPDPKQTYEYTRGGITYRTNLTVVKRLKMEFKPGTPLNTTEISVLVGEKNGQLFITTAAPVK